MIHGRSFCSVFDLDQLDSRLREDTFSLLSLSWLAILPDWYDFQPMMETCKITKHLAQTFQSKFHQHDRLISLQSLSLFPSPFYPLLRQHIFTICLNETDLNTQILALQVFPLMQFHLRTRDFLPIFYQKFSSKDLHEQLKPFVMEIWRMHRCLFDLDATSIHLKVISILLESFHRILPLLETRSFRSENSSLISIDLFIMFIVVMQSILISYGFLSDEYSSDLSSLQSTISFSGNHRFLPNIRSSLSIHSSNSRTR